MLTNMSEETVVKEAMRLGAYAYLLKVKFTPPALVEKVKEFISFHNTQIQ
jgi:DNA-binding NarL/FixJ family response regulator